MLILPPANERELLLSSASADSMLRFFALTLLKTILRSLHCRAESVISDSGVTLFIATEPSCTLNL